MNFGKFGVRQPKSQSFDKEKITLTKAGQTYNVYDAIQAANVDTDIVEVMKKYHCTIDEGIEFMEKKGGMQGIYGEFAALQEKAQSIPDIIKLQEKSEELFNALPTEIKEKYQNNLEKFFVDLNNQAKKINEEKNQNKDQDKPEGDTK